MWNNVEYFNLFPRACDHFVQQRLLVAGYCWLLLHVRYAYHLILAHTGNEITVRQIFQHSQTRREERQQLIGIAAQQLFTIPIFTVSPRDTEHNMMPSIQT